MYKAKNSDVKDLIKWGEQDETISKWIESGYQPMGHILAYYTPSQANWSYQIGIYNIDGKAYELLTRFGSVEGGRSIYFQYQSSEKEA